MERASVRSSSSWSERMLGTSKRGSRSGRGPGLPRRPFVAAGAMSTVSSLTVQPIAKRLPGGELRGPAGDDARAGPDLGVVDRLEAIARERHGRRPAPAVQPVVAEDHLVVEQLDRAERAADRPGVAAHLEDVGHVHAQPQLDVEVLARRRVALDHDLLVQAAADPAGARDAQLAPGEARGGRLLVGRVAPQLGVGQLDRVRVAIPVRPAEQGQLGPVEPQDGASTGSAYRGDTDRARDRPDGCHRAGRSAGSGCPPW